MGFLTDVVDALRRDLERAPLDAPALMARAMVLPPPRDLAAALEAGAETAGAGSPAVIAEVKRASPSAGAIADRDPGDQAAAYEAAGASAISVLTEAKHFGGSIADVRAVRRRTTVPVLRKDFLIDPAQVIESRAEGADAVLLIAGCLPGLELRAMLSAATDLGLGSLVETHTEEDLERAIASGARVIGVNARDLETLAVDAAAARRSLRRIPPGVIAVLESGIADRADARAAADAGASAILVGEALMRAPDPGAKVRELLGSDRRAGGASTPAGGTRGDAAGRSDGPARRRSGGEQTG
jgi:indole-3-glycerol phosphate synthase